MLEGTINSRIMTHTRGLLRGAVVRKHADRFTRDEPDISVIHRGYTFYCETKYLRAKDKLKDILRVSQLLFCGQVATASDGKCWFLVYEDAPQTVSVWTPQALFSYAFPALATTPVMTREPYPVDEATQSLAGYIFSYGAIRVPGRPYDLLARLIQQKVRS